MSANGEDAVRARLIDLFAREGFGAGMTEAGRRQMHERWADAVIADLGIERLGWGCRVEGRITVSSIRAQRPTHAGAEFYEPVYAMQFGSRGGAE